MCESLLQRKKDALVAAAGVQLHEVDEETRRLITIDFRTAAGVLAASRLFKHGQMRKHGLTAGGDGEVMSMSSKNEANASQKDIEFQFVTDLIKRTVKYISEHQLHLHEFDDGNLPSFVREADLGKLAGDSPVFFDLDMTAEDRKLVGRIKKFIPDDDKPVLQLRWRRIAHKIALHEGDIELERDVRKVVDSSARNYEEKYSLYLT